MVADDRPTPPHLPLERGGIRRKEKGLSLNTLLSINLQILRKFLFKNIFVYIEYRLKFFKKNLPKYENLDQIWYLATDPM